MYYARYHEWLYDKTTDEMYTSLQHLLVNSNKYC